METKEYTTCFYCNNTKIKMNKIIKHKQVCKFKPFDDSVNMICCPYNSYHWISSGDLEFHKEICQNKPKDKSDEKKKEELDLKNQLQEYINNLNSNEIKNSFDSTQDMTKIASDVMNQTNDHSNTNQSNTNLYNPNEISEEDIYNYNL